MQPNPTGTPSDEQIRAGAELHAEMDATMGDADYWRVLALQYLAGVGPLAVDRDRATMADALENLQGCVAFYQHVAACVQTAADRLEAAIKGGRNGA